MLTQDYTIPKSHYFRDSLQDWLEEDYSDAGVADDDTSWLPGKEDWSDFLFEEKKETSLAFSISASEFTEFAFRMPRHDAQGYENFSFEGRRHMRDIYDTPARRVLLIAARQVEKSTCLGNKILAYCCLVPAFRFLYVSPSATQTKTFSVDRIKEPIETSPILKSYTTKMLSQNVFEKQFANRSKLTLRYAYLNADRARGIPAYGLALDEIQDILNDNIPVIEECLSHAPPQWKTQVYSGTPKTLDNTIEYYRSELSTQGEWVVPCDCQGGEGGRFWNILGEKNIGKKFLICGRCGKQLFAMADGAQWAAQVEYHPVRAPFESFRIPQLMVPWKPWEDILLNYRRYPRDRFYNEVLGLSYDSGVRPLTRQQLIDSCREDVSMSPECLRSYQERSADNPIFAGIDWGSGDRSYSVLTLATYVDMKFRVFYMHRFVAEEAEPAVQVEKIIRIIRAFNVKIVGTDYGYGFAMNDSLIRKFGPQRIQRFAYSARLKKKVENDPRLRRWKVHRSEVMSDIFNAIKRRQFEFPKWDEFKEPYASDMLNIFSEYNETLHMIQYGHHPDKPDDSFHSLVFCFLASMVLVPRPDIIAPSKELPHQGPRFGGAPSEPIDQG